MVIKEWVVTVIRNTMMVTATITILDRTVNRIALLVVIIVILVTPEQDSSLLVIISNRSIVKEVEEWNLVIGIPRGIWVDMGVMGAGQTIVRTITTAQPCGTRIDSMIVMAVGMTVVEEAGETIVIVLIGIIMTAEWEMSTTGTLVIHIRTEMILIPTMMGLAVTAPINDVEIGMKMIMIHTRGMDLPVTTVIATKITITRVAEIVTTVMVVIPNTVTMGTW